MILKGLPEFFQYNREMSSKGLLCLTWREFQRMKKNLPRASQKTSEAPPLLEAPKYRGHPDNQSATVPEALGRDVVSDDFLEPEALVISPVSEET